MSKKKIFALICLVAFTLWGLVSLYFYNKHVVTVKEYKVGERIELSEGIVMVHSIKIHDFEGKPFNFRSLEWFYEKVLPIIPVKLQQPLMRAIAFYRKPYNFDLGKDDIEGRIMYLYGIYVSNEGKAMFVDDNLKIYANVATENGLRLTSTGSGNMGAQGSNTRLFHSSGKFFLNEYSPDSAENLIINVKDTVSNESHKITLQPAWETKKYNFFNRPPAMYSFSPDEAVDKFIRLVVYEKDLKAAKEYVHPLLHDFPWDKLDHDEWSRNQGRVTRYLGSYLGFNDVFTTIITYEDSDESKDAFEQTISLVNYNGEWKTIDVSPLTTIDGF